MRNPSIDDGAALSDATIARNGACCVLSTRRTLCVFDVGSGQRRYCSARGEAFTAVAQLGSSSLLAVVARTSPRALQLLNTTDGTVMRQINCRTAVLGVRMTRDRLVVRLRAAAHVFDLDTLERLATVECGHASRAAFALSPPTVMVFNVGTAKMELRRVQPLLVLPSAQTAGSVDVVDAATLRLIRVVAAHRTDVACLALSADGALLATASTRGTVVRVFSLVDASASKVASFRRGRTQARITTMRFSNDGRYLVVGSESPTVHVFALGARRADGSAASRARAVLCLQAQPGCAACAFCALRPEDRGSARRQRLCIISTSGDLALFTVTEPSEPGQPFDARLDAQHCLDVAKRSGGDRS
jgi:autophagy-related protein 18